MTRIYFIRHAESAANAGLATSTPDSIPLTATGEAQAALLAQSLAEPQLIVASPYIRTQQTAQPTRQKHPQAAFEIWPIQEFTYLPPASFEGTTAAQRQPAKNAYWNKLDPDSSEGAGAESFNHLLERVRRMRVSLHARREATITVFTHGQLMRAMMFMCQYPELNAKQIMERFLDTSIIPEIPNCGIVEGAILGGRFSLSQEVQSLIDSPVPGLSLG